MKMMTTLGFSAAKAAPQNAERMRRMSGFMVGAWVFEIMGKNLRARGTA
jgi:hypothetical protein